jgi:transposase InsO family protein
LPSCLGNDRGGCIRALEKALNYNPVREELIHHSDRGLQYCSYGYIKRLQDHSIAISRTQKGDPLENALAERINGILKDELLETTYATFSQAQVADLSLDKQMLQDVLKKSFEASPAQGAGFGVAHRLPGFHPPDLPGSDVASLGLVL